MIRPTTLAATAQLVVHGVVSPALQRDAAGRVLLAPWELDAHPFLRQLASLLPVYHGLPLTTRRFQYRSKK